MGRHYPKRTLASSSLSLRVSLALFGAYPGRSLETFAGRFRLVFGFGGGAITGDGGGGISTTLRWAFWAAISRKRSWLRTAGWSAAFCTRRYVPSASSSLAFMLSARLIARISWT